MVLRRHALQCHHPAAPRTRRRERGLVGRINPGGNRAARPAPIPAAGSSARLPAVALGPILGERRGLPEPRPPRGCKLLLQALVLPLQSIVLTLQVLVLTSHLIPLASQLIPLPAPFALPPSAAARPPRRPAGSARPDRQWNACAHRPRDTYDRLVRIVQVQNIGFE